MSFIAKNFEQLLGLNGFSDQLLNNHFTLYNGYVANTNKLEIAISEMEESEKISSPEYAEIKRRFGWEWNGMRLHELYFENITKKENTIQQAPAIKNKIENDFGSVEKWEKAFRAVGSMRGIGWVILYHDTVTDKLTISWINEHDTGHLVGNNPLLVMDVFEHAFMLDYGLKRADYINSFFNAIDWSIVENRLK